MFAIVLARNAFRENDEIITIYTNEQGKIDVLARGSKKILSKNSASLEPFCFVDLEVLQGKEHKILGSVQNINSFSGLRKNFQKIILVRHTLDLLNNLTQDNLPDKKIFVFLYSWLKFLNNSNNDLDFINLFNSFALKLSALLGFLPQLNFCVHCSRRYDGAKNWFFYFGGGGIFCWRCKNAQKAMFCDLAFLGNTRGQFIKLIITKFEDVSSFGFSQADTVQVHKLVLQFFESFSEKEIKKINLVFLS
jgi:DNA repair protein RecO (recombination protein O)